MSHKESFNRAIKDDHLDVLVSFNRCDDFVELRNRCRTEDVERRMIKRYSPIVGRAPRKMYLLRACCRVTFIFHVLSPMNFQPLFKSTYCHWQGERALLATHLPRHLENDFQLDRRALSQIIENRKVAARKL